MVTIAMNIRFNLVILTLMSASLFTHVMGIFTALTVGMKHGDHIDYIVDGRLHHQHGDHCDDHGPIELV
ncbi:hypothetical protein AND4_00678 [Vibrio sp. AND4]|nr:hypothetical protein AND4_00678 [Vibrio sp. AND4]